MPPIVGHLRTDPSLHCYLCGLVDDDELRYGQFYTIGDITVHYFCILLSTKMVQSGLDRVGVLGFLYKDIKSELKLSYARKCVHCKDTGATVFCGHKSCRKVWHFPCGLKNSALAVFFGNFQSFCKQHRKEQIIPKHILDQRSRLVVKLTDCLNTSIKNVVNKPKEINRNICRICYDTIIFTENTYNVFWPPCCKSVNWFHRDCLARMAVSAGKYFIRCPFCNDQNKFLKGLYQFGIYIPEQDASWEREEGAFSELLKRSEKCIATTCICPVNRDHCDSDRWEMVFCHTCGSESIHRKCAKNMGCTNFECYRCVRDEIKFIKCENDTDEEIDVENDEPAVSIKHEILSNSISDLDNDFCKPVAHDELDSCSNKSVSSDEQLTNTIVCVDLTSSIDEEKDRLVPRNKKKKNNKKWYTNWKNFDRRNFIHSYLFPSKKEYSLIKHHAIKKKRAKSKIQCKYQDIRKYLV